MASNRGPLTISTRGTHRSTPPLLLFVLFLLWGTIVTVVSSGPADVRPPLLNGKRTLAFFMEGEEYMGPAGLYRNSLSSISLSSRFFGARPVMVLTKEENLMLASLLTTYADTVEQLPSEKLPMDGAFPADYDVIPYSTEFLLTPKAMLKASFTSDCLYKLRLCCPAYWMGDSLQSRLPLSSVPSDHIFWNGTHTVNGFFTNFSDTYLKHFDCLSPPDNAGDALAVDKNGEWRLASSTSVVSLREYDLTPYINLPTEAEGINASEKWLRTQAKTAEATLQDAMRGDTASFGNSFVLLAAVVPSALLLVLLALLLLLYVCDYRPRHQTLKAYRLQFPDRPFSAKDPQTQDGDDAAAAKPNNPATHRKKGRLISGRRRRAARTKKPEATYAKSSSSSSCSSCSSSSTASSVSSGTPSRSPPSRAGSAPPPNKLMQSPVSLSTSPCAYTRSASETLPRSASATTPHFVPAGPAMQRQGSFTVLQPSLYPNQPPYMAPARSNSYSNLPTLQRQGSHLSASGGSFRIPAQVPQGGGGFPNFGGPSPQPPIAQAASPYSLPPQQLAAPFYPPLNTTTPSGSCGPPTQQPYALRRSSSFTRCDSGQAPAFPFAAAVPAAPAASAASPTSILVKTSSFRKTGGSNPTTPTSTSPSLQQAAAPPPLVRTSSATQMPCDESRHTAELKKRENPFKNRDSFRKV